MQQQHWAGEAASPGLRREGIMEHVLIVDPDAIHSAGMEDALEAADYLVSVHRDYRTIMQALIPEGISTVVFVSSSPSRWRNDLKALCGSMADAKRAIDVLCLLRWPSVGPGDRLFGEQLNVRVIHEY